MTKIKTAVYRDERTWFFTALIMLSMIFMLYVYFVISSVVHVVMRKELDQEIVATSSYVSQLEAEYIEVQHAISEDIASLNGYAPVEEKIFIDKTPATLVLSMEHEG